VKLYVAFAIHSNGKVEREGSYQDKLSAILSACDLASMLNLYHRSGKAYDGKDKLVGRKYPQNHFDRILKRHDVALRKLMTAHKKSSGSEPCQSVK
jgi:hypothetical protein